MGIIRPGSKTLGIVLKTDELYGHDGLWLGPRGRDYGAMLPNPKPYQHANLFPDPNSTYWFAILEMPEGSVLTLRGRYPFGRYFQFALYRSDVLGGLTATGEYYVDHEIEPDPGSTNPFIPGTRRDLENRDYTLRIANVDAPPAPTDREPNTLYAGTAAQIQVVYRVYQPDQGYLGDAGAELPSYIATLADGTELSTEEIRKQFNRPLLQGLAPGMPVEHWRALCGASDNDPALKTETTPARNPPVLERYFNNTYNLIGIFQAAGRAVADPAHHRNRLRRRPGDTVHARLRLEEVRARACDPRHDAPVSGQLVRRGGEWPRRDDRLGVAVHVAGHERVAAFRDGD